MNFAAKNFSVISESFGIDQSQIIPIAQYLTQITNLPIDYNGNYINVDGYSMMLARYSHFSLMNETVSLMNDAFWAPPARSLFCEFTKLNVQCYTIMRGGANSTLSTLICADPVLG